MEPSAVSSPAQSSSSENADHNSKPTLVRGLGLLDSVLLLAGGIIGSSIFLTAKDVATALPHPLLFLLAWVLGGGISLLGCTAFAELGSMFPDSGGQYVYVREAFGDLVAFLYGWMLFAVGNGGSIAALAVASAAYLGQIVPSISQEHVVLMIGTFAVNRAQIVGLIMIVATTWINVVGLRRATVVQNLATWAKFGAIGAFVLLGLAIGKGDWSHFRAEPSIAGQGLAVGMSATQLLSAFGVALIAILWAYDGWVYITWVAGEVKEPRRNVPRSMVIGVLIVGVVYLAMNTMYVYALPLSQVARHETIVYAAGIALFSPGAAVWLAAAIALSCFGALACAVLSCPRVYYAMALDGTFFPKMAQVHPKWRTPAFALIGQAIWAGILTLSGRYDQLYTYVMFGMVLFYTLTVVGLFRLRRERPEIPRPYRCTGYPWLPGLYVLIGVAWTLNMIVTRPMEAGWGTAIVLAGVPGYWYWKRRSKRIV